LALADLAGAAFAAQKLPLPPQGIHEPGLSALACGGSPRQGTLVPVAAAQHLRNLEFMPRE